MQLSCQKDKYIFVFLRGQFTKLFYICGESLDRIPILINKRHEKTKYNDVCCNNMYCLPAFYCQDVTDKKQIDSSTIEYINLKEDVHLEDNTTSPACKMTIDYAYLAEENGNDTIAHKINHTVQSTIFRKEVCRNGTAGCYRLV